MISRAFDFIKKNRYIIGILLIGAILRLYNYKELFSYGHDQDLQGWFIRDVLNSHHLRLIGQETSTQGIFIGPVFYYLLIPFYIFTKMDAIGGVFMTALIGLFTIWSFYFVLSKMFSKSTGLMAAFLYSLSFYTVFNDREVVPTMPVILWTVWFLYGIYLIYKGRSSKGLMLLALLSGLIWELNMALIILLPVILLSIFLAQKKPVIKDYLISIGIFFATSMPLLLFELRHNFSQTKYFITSLTTNQHDIVSGSEKLWRVYHLMSKNFAGVIWGDYFELRYEYIFWLFIAISAILLIKKKFELKLGLLFASWISIYLIFFSLYSKIVSEYYLNGTIVVFIVIFSLGISSLIANKRYKDFGYAFLLLFTIVNFDRFLSLPVNKSGYVERNQVIDAIKSDQLSHDFPCVSISYITNPGYDRGYRYFIWQKGIKTKQISDKVPVYTIVFPLKKIFQVDRTFGAIGLIYPDYKKYNLTEINSSCNGEDFNLTDPMIGFTN